MATIELQNNITLILNDKPNPDKKKGLQHINILLQLATTEDSPFIVISLLASTSTPPPPSFIFKWPSFFFVFCDAHETPSYFIWGAKNLEPSISCFLNCRYYVMNLLCWMKLFLHGSSREIHTQFQTKNKHSTKRAQLYDILWSQNFVHSHISPWAQSYISSQPAKSLPEDS